MAGYCSGRLLSARPLAFNAITRFWRVRLDSFSTDAIPRLWYMALHGSRREDEHANRPTTLRRLSVFRFSSHAQRTGGQWDNRAAAVSAFEVVPLAGMRSPSARGKASYSASQLLCHLWKCCPRDTCTRAVVTFMLTHTSHPHLPPTPHPPALLPPQPPVPTPDPPCTARCLCRTASART